MLIGSGPLGSLPLGSALAGATIPEPVYVVRGAAYVWRVLLMVGGVDRTAQLTGLIDTDREEGAAGVAGFTLLLPPGPVVPDEWTGLSVELDYISRDRYGVVTTARLYTGALEMPSWDSTTRMLSCECGDQMQDRVEGLTIDQINTLIPGYWSADVFEPIDGRSRWEYAQELLSTLPASLDSAATGELRLTSWFATHPHFVFGPGTTLYKSIQTELQPRGAITSQVEIEASYRYARLWQNNVSYGWAHPETGGSVGIPGFCNWRTWTTELPTTEMVESAVSGAGLTIVGQVGGYKLPGNLADPCGDGASWQNPFDNLWLSLSVTGAQRWVQSVTERYSITLKVGSPAVPVIVRESASFEVESILVDDWEAGEPSSSGGLMDLNDESRRVSFLSCLVNQGYVTLVDAHRGTTVSWQTPTDMALGVDLIHTLQVDDTTKATGKCRRIQHRLDLTSGRATTTLSIALMRAGAEGDPLTLPDSPDTSLPLIPYPGGPLATQLGGRLNDPYTGFPIPPYDPDRLGFSGNWTDQDDLTAEMFPREFKIENVEIPAEYRDELVGNVTASYQVAIPNDPLEM